jgi:hypothetical protein
MSQEDVDAAIGKLIRRRNELKTRAVALKSEALDKGNALQDLALAVRSQAELIVIEGQPTNFHSKSRLYYSMDGLNAESIAKLTDDLRATSEELALLSAN